MNTIFRSSTFRGWMVTALVGALAASASVYAAHNNSESKVVSFADLEISTPAGATELYGRIDAAAASVCSYFWFRSSAAEARCIHDAIANAVADVNEPALIAVYNLKNRKPLRGRRSTESLLTLRGAAGH